MNWSTSHGPGSASPSNVLAGRVYPTDEQGWSRQSVTVDDCEADAATDTCWNGRVDPIGASRASSPGLDRPLRTSELPRASARVGHHALWSEPRPQGLARRAGAVGRGVDLVVGRRAR